MSVCCVHIATDDVAPSFMALCAPHAAKIPNYSTTTETSYVLGYVYRTELLWEVSIAGSYRMCVKTTSFLPVQSWVA